MRISAPKFLLAALVTGAVMFGCGPMYAPWYPYSPPAENTNEFFGEIFRCVGSAFRGDKMNEFVRSVAPKSSEINLSRYSFPDVPFIAQYAKTIGMVLETDDSGAKAGLKKILGMPPQEFGEHFDACFALIDQNPDTAVRTAQDLRLYLEVMRKGFRNSVTMRDTDTYEKTYRRSLLTLVVLEMGQAKKAGPDPGALAAFKSLVTKEKERRRIAVRSDSALGRAESAMDATEAQGGNLDGMIDTAVGHSSGSINEDEAKASLLKLDKARARADAGYEAAMEGEFDTAKENVKKAREERSGAQDTLKAGKKGQCDHLLKDLKEAKTECDAGKKIFCEAFEEKRGEFIKKCGKGMLPKELRE